VASTLAIKLIVGNVRI